MKVAELEGVALALWMARACGHKDAFYWTSPSGKVEVYLRPTDSDPFMPHEDWKDGGPLHDQFKVGIERTVQGDDTRVYAYVPADPLSGFYGETALIAAGRAIVASVYGEEVPDA